MKGFNIFDTTNTLYGSFYKKSQDPVTNIPKFRKPDMEEQFYYTTQEMSKAYFNRYMHLYKDPTGKVIDNPIDAKAFNESDAAAHERRVLERMQNSQPQEIQTNENFYQTQEAHDVPLERTKAVATSFPEKPLSQTVSCRPQLEPEPEPMQTFHRTFEATN